MPSIFTGERLHSERHNDSTLHFFLCFHGLLNAEGHSNLVDLVAIPIVKERKFVAQFSAAFGSLIAGCRPPRGKNDGEAQCGKFLGLIVKEFDARFANVSRRWADVG